MRVAIVGSRDCRDLPLSRVLAELPENCTVIISGGAKGVDALAQRAARERRLPFRLCAPDYKAYGRGAPLVRNKKIVDSADLVLAFWDFDSRGTAHTIAYCIERGVPVRIIGIDEQNG